MKAGAEFVVKLYRVLLPLGILLFCCCPEGDISGLNLQSYSIKPTKRIILIGNTDGENKSILKLMAVLCT